MIVPGIALHPDKIRTSIAIGLLAAAAVTAPAQPETRGLWISRFEWPNPNPAVAQANIDTALQQMADHNFNAAFLQVRGQADVLYPSPYEVWSPLIGGADPGWDPLQYAINAAHSRGIELHAYVNTHVCWQSGSSAPPPNPNHVFYQHADASNPAARDWLHHNSPTDPVQFSESDYVWFAPGVPAFQAYTRQQVMYIVENYDVDGIHYDRIRTPWSNQPSFDPISLARFNDPQSNPDNLDFTTWTADQINRHVRDMYAAIMAVKPDVQVSAALFHNPATAPTAQHQDGLNWANTGGIDICMPMAYFSGGQGSTWDTRIQTWVNGTNRFVVAGQITSVGNPMLISQIDVTRLRGGTGNAVFSLTSFTGWPQYLSQVYQTPVATPAIPWKDNPTTGIIIGTITDNAAASIVDVQITRNGSTYTALSSDDGFYSFLLVPPGSYTLTYSHPAYGQESIPGVIVTAGDVTTWNFQYSGVLAPIIQPVTPDPDSALVGQEYTRQLTLAQGLADTWQLLSAPSGAIISSEGYVSGWTPGPGQSGQSFGFTARATNSAGFDDMSWNVAVTDQPPCDRVALADFDDYSVGQAVMFNLPRFSGSTSGDLAASPNVAQIDDSAGGFSGTTAMRFEWAFVDTLPERWVRLTTFNGQQVPNPTIPLDRPLRLRVRLDSGRLLASVGIRETGTLADIGENGGTGGTIEWLGANGDVNGAPQGVLIEGAAGVWQTIVLDPAADPVHAFTGDGILFSASGKGVLEHVAFSIVDGVGPFTVWIDDIEVLCPLPPYGDLDGDGEVTPADAWLFLACMDGPDVPVSGECLDADQNGDGDVDTHDFAEFQVLVR